MALLSSSNFSTYLTPDGATGPPANASQVAVLTLSDGTGISIGTKEACLGLLEWMRLRRIWMVQLSDDVFAISIGATKLMFCENSLVLQRWVTSFSAIYQSGSTLFAHRNLSSLSTLYDSLLQSGQLFRSTGAINGNLDLVEVHAVLLDWNWPDSRLVDSPPIRYTP